MFHFCFSLYYTKLSIHLWQVSTRLRVLCYRLCSGGFQIGNGLSKADRSCRFTSCTTFMPSLASFLVRYQLFLRQNLSLVFRMMRRRLPVGVFLAMCGFKIVAFALFSCLA